MPAAGSWPPLAIGPGATEMIKDLRAMNAQIYGTIFASHGVIGGDVTVEGSFIGNDYLSANWDGAIPVDLSSFDATATAGFAWDASLGSAQLMGDMWVGGDVIVGDINGIFTKLTGWSGVIQFDDQSDVAGPDNAAYIIPGAVDEGDIGGGNHAWRADLLFYGMEWTAGGDLPWQRMTSVNQYHPGYGFIQWGFGPSSEVWFDLDESGLITSQKDHYFDGYIRPTAFGTASLPTIAWHDGLGNYDTGIYRSGVNQIGHTFGGAGVRWIMGDTYLTAAEVTGAARIATQAGDTSWPSYGFQGDNNTGVMRPGADSLALVAGGFQMLTITEAGGNASSLQIVGAKAGHTWLPHGNGNIYLTCDDDESFFFRDYNGTSYVTRMVLSNGDDLQVLGAIRAGTQGEGGLTNGYLYHIPGTTGVAPNTTQAVATGSTYYLQRFTSARKYKKHISYKTDRLADIELKPVSFWRDDDDEWFLGFIADDLAEEDYRLATYEGVDGSAIDENSEGGVRAARHSSDPKAEVEGVQTLAVLAVLAAKIIRLETQVKELQGGIH